MKILKKKNKQIIENTDCSLEVSHSQLDYQLSNSGSKPKERRSLGGRVEKREKKGSRFSRLALHKLFRGTTVTPKQEVDGDTSLVDVSPGDSGRYKRYEGISDSSALSGANNYLSMDAGNTPPKRGRLRKVHSSLVMEKMLGRFITNEAGSTPKERGKIKVIDTQKVLQILVGKENMDLQSPFGTKGCAALGKSIYDETQNEIRGEKLHKAHSEGRLDLKSGSVLHDSSKEIINNAEPMPRRSPRFSGRTAARPPLSKTPPALRYAKGRLGSHSSKDDPVESCAATCDNSESHSPETDVMEIAHTNENHYQTSLFDISQNSILAMGPNLSASILDQSNSSSHRKSLNSSKVQFSEETETIDRDHNVSSLSVLSRQMEKLGSCLSSNTMRDEHGMDTGSSGSDDGGQHNTTTCSINISLRGRSSRTQPEPVAAKIIAMNESAEGKPKKIPPKKPPRKKKFQPDITVTSRDAGHTPKPQRKQKEAYNERLV